jgi:fatty acid desaturase
VNDDQIERERRAGAVAHLDQLHAESREAALKWDRRYHFWYRVQVVCLIGNIASTASAWRERVLPLWLLLFSGIVTILLICLTVHQDRIHQCPLEK